MASFTFGYGGAYGYRGSLSLAQILYQTQLGDFTYDTDSSGNVVLTNQGNIGTSYDGLPYSGRGIELGATNDVDIHIHHTLGAEKVTNLITTFFTGDETSSYTKISETAFDLSVTVVGTQTNRPAILNTIDATVVGETYLLSFDATITSGTAVISNINMGAGAQAINHTVVNGRNEIEVTATAITTNQYVYFDGTNLFDISVTNWAYKQITNPNSYLTYYDFTDGLVTLGNSVDGGSSVELVDNWDFSSDTNTFWTIINGVISNGVLNVNYSGSETALLQKTGILTMGRSYIATFDVKNYTSGSIKPYFGNVLGGTITSNGTYSQIIHDVSDSRLQMNVTDGTVLELDNISVKEILPISTKYTLNTKTVNNIIAHTTTWSSSDWTRINNNPNLIGKLALETTSATKTIPELDMVMDRGPELVTNGTFSTDTSGWTIQNTDINNTITWENSAVRLISDNTLSVIIKQDGVFEIGKTYEVSINVLEITGTAKLIDTLGTLISELTTTGMKTYTFIATHTGVGVNRFGICNILFDNISVKEVVQDSYHMCSEKSGAYLVDSRVGYGTEEVSNTTFDTATGWVLSGATISGGTLTTDLAGITYGYTVPLTTLSVGEFYYVEIDVVSYTGTGNSIVLTGYGANPSKLTIDNTGILGKILVPYDTNQFIQLVSEDGSSATITSISVREATATEIANHAETVRTNADLQQKGIQTTAFVTDGAGVPTSYSDNLLQFTGDGRYVDTGFMPPSDSAWEIDFVMEARADGMFKVHGIYGTASAQYLFIGQSDTNKLYAFVGSSSLGTAGPVATDGLHYLRIEFNGATGGRLVVDNTTAYTFSGSNYTYSISESFFIGGHSRGGAIFTATNNVSTPVAYFDYILRERTASERNACYANLKAIYPTLP